MSSITPITYVFNDSNLEFTAIIVPDDAEVPSESWFKRSRWTSACYRYRGKWSKDWRVYNEEAKVVGTSVNARAINFFRLNNKPGFRIHLKRDPNNSHDPNAIAVIGSALSKGKIVKRRIGYLSRELAAHLKDIKEIKAVPSVVWLPTDETIFGLRIKILVRSQAYLRRTGKCDPNIDKEKQGPVLEDDVRTNVMHEVREWYEDEKQYYYGPHLSDNMFNNKVNELFDAALSRQHISEDEANNDSTDKIELEYAIVDDIFGEDDISDILFKNNTLCD